MLAVLEQRALDGFRAVDEQAPIETVLLLGDPVAASIPADKDDRRGRATRWRFDVFHVGYSSQMTAGEALSEVVGEDRLVERVCLVRYNGNACLDRWRAGALCFNEGSQDSQRQIHVV